MISLFRDSKRHPLTYRLHYVDWNDPHAVALRDSLDAEMTDRYAGSHDDVPDFAERAEVAFGVDAATILETVVIDDEEGEMVAHAALRMLGDRYEVKRVIVAPGHRGSGLGRMLMEAVERAAFDRGATSVILQTGDRQPDAVAMYEKLGYLPIPIYEPYTVIENSMCFEKQLA